MLEKAGFGEHAGEVVLVQSRSLRTSDPAYRRELSAVVTRLAAMPQVTKLRSPLSPGNAGQFSKDGHSALVEFEMKGPAEGASERVQPVLAAVSALQRSAPAFDVQEFGEASGEREVQQDRQRRALPGPRSCRSRSPSRCC